MKIFKITIAILIVIIFTTSCSQDDENTNAKNLLLTKTTSTDGLVATYQYDANNRCINYKLNGNGSNASRDYNFNYNIDGTLDNVAKNEDGFVLAKYTYDANKQIIKTVLNYDNTVVYNYTYNGNMITELQSSILNPSPIARKVYIKDSNNNVSKVLNYSSVNINNPNGILTLTNIYTYDDKQNKNMSLPQEFYFPQSSKNNVLTEGNDVSLSTFVYNYEYNTDGYPTKRTRGNEIITYEYK